MGGGGEIQKWVVELREGGKGGKEGKGGVGEVEMEVGEVLNINEEGWGGGRRGTSSEGRYRGCL